jgi:hypothetical protein
MLLQAQRRNHDGQSRPCSPATASRVGERRPRHEHDAAVGARGRGALRVGCLRDRVEEVVSEPRARAHRTVEPLCAGAAPTTSNPAAPTSIAK